MLQDKDGKKGKETVTLLALWCKHFWCFEIVRDILFQYKFNVEEHMQKYHSMSLDELQTTFLEMFRIMLHNNQRLVRPCLLCLIETITFGPAWAVGGCSAARTNA